MDVVKKEWEWHSPSMWQVYSGALWHCDSTQYTVHSTPWTASSSLTAWCSCHTLAPDWRDNSHIWPLIGRHTSELPPIGQEPGTGHWFWLWHSVTQGRVVGCWDLRVTQLASGNKVCERDICYWLWSPHHDDQLRISSWWWCYAMLIGNMNGDSNTHKEASSQCSLCFRTSIKTVIPVEDFK